LEKKFERQIPLNWKGSLKNQKTKGVWSIRERKLKSIGINFSCIPTPEKVKIQEKNQRGFELKRD
jgi:hypothetical protein